MELTPEQHDELLTDLRALRDDLAATLKSSEALTETVHLDQAAVGRVSRVDALQAQQMAEAGRRRAELRYKRVMVALKTADDGDYGICKLCGDDIGYGRLKAQPESPVCVACMAEIE